VQSQHLELSDYLPADWQLCPPTLRGIRLIAPNGEDASLFFEGAKRYLKQTAEHLKATIEVIWEGCEKPLEIAPPNNPAPILMTKTELDLTAFYRGDSPTYINQLSDQTNLWCNLAALSAQGKKPSEFLIIQNAFSLNYEHELQRRMDLLISDGSLSDYEYEAMRWHQDENGLWIRKRMRFCSQFHLVEYLGERCWLGIVGSAEPTGTHADS
jgi:hypothetical protein